VQLSNRFVGAEPTNHSLTDLPLNLELRDGITSTSPVLLNLNLTDNFGGNLKLLKDSQPVYGFTLEAKLDLIKQTR